MSRLEYESSLYNYFANFLEPMMKTTLTTEELKEQARLLKESIYRKERSCTFSNELGSLRNHYNTVAAELANRGVFV